MMEGNVELRDFPKREVVLVHVDPYLHSLAR